MTLFAMVARLSKEICLARQGTIGLRTRLIGDTQKKDRMKKKPITPKMHAIIDYTLLAGLLVLPKALGLDKTVKKIYVAEALGLLAYVGMTEQPAAIKPLIPFKIHGKIDPFNVLQFAAQTLTKPFRRDKKAMIFNAIFTAIAGVTVLLTDWSGRTQPKIS